MKKTNGVVHDPDMRAHYDLANLRGIRGKYADRFSAKGGCYLVSVDLDLRDYFPDDASVNAALHELATMNSRALRGQRKSA